MASATAFQLHTIDICVDVCVPVEGDTGAVAETVCVNVVGTEISHSLYDQTYLVMVAPQEIPVSVFVVAAPISIAEP